MRVGRMSGFQVEKVQISRSCILVTIVIDGGGKVRTFVCASRRHLTLWLPASLTSYHHRHLFFRPHLRFPQPPTFSTWVLDGRAVIWSWGKPRKDFHETVQGVA